MGNFIDGITNLYEKLANRRNAANNNAVTSQRLGWEQMRAIYKTGLGSKIIRLKAGHALKNTLQFDSKDDEIFYRNKLEKHVKNATKYMIGFGRSIIVLHEPGADLSTRFTGTQDPEAMRYHVFPGDMVSVSSVNLDLSSPDYFRPTSYHVRGVSLHPSRVIDFKYVEPTEMEAPQYFYGGISEFEMIYTQIISDGIVERATPSILEKNATLFYKVMGLKEAIMQGREDDMVTYFTALENGRSIYGAALVDAEDEVEVVNQVLTNLSEADQITLRRLAMVTGIPLSILVGEAVKGLNGTGESELKTFQDMIEALQSDYLLDPVNLLMHRLGQGRVEFKENQGETPLARATYEKTVLENAVYLHSMGEDYRAYLNDKDIIQKDEFDLMFPEEREETDVDTSLSLEQLMPGLGNEA